MEPVLLYITARDKQQAVEIARALLEARLIACANVLPGAVSLYRWEGDIQSADECVLMAKSVRGRVADVVEKVKQLHSYACPCVVAMPIEGGNAEFLKWVAEEVG